MLLLRLITAGNPASPSYAPSGRSFRPPLVSELPKAPEARWLALRLRTTLTSAPAPHTSSGRGFLLSDPIAAVPTYRSLALSIKAPAAEVDTSEFLIDSDDEFLIDYDLADLVDA